MNTKNILLPAIAGTSLMTFFSYIIAELEEKNFSEPELLALIVKKALPRKAKKLALPAGWVTHYFIGVIITVSFQFMRQNKNTKSAFKETLALAVISGLTAIITWNLLLKTLPKRSVSFYRKYYTQLFIAHFVFAAAVIVTQKATANR